MSLRLNGKVSMANYVSNLANQVMIGVLILLCLSYINCEEECLKSKVLCYECESTKSSGCSDPFNASQELKLCSGCCVKVVRKRNTPSEHIWRTCTSRLQINLFMVDHVCMEESGSQGHMCFCETDACNSSPSLIGTSHWPLAQIYRIGSLVGHHLISSSSPTEIVSTLLMHSHSLLLYSLLVLLLFVLV